MSRVTIVFMLLSLSILNSGDKNVSYINKTNNNNNNNNHHHHGRARTFGGPRSSGINSTRVVNRPVSSVVSVFENKKEESDLVQQQHEQQKQLEQQQESELQEEEQQQEQQMSRHELMQQQQQSKEEPMQQREKRATPNYELDEAEIARQNQITQQIFAKYLERRLFPNRSSNDNVPTISEILPKTIATTTTTTTTTTTEPPKPRSVPSILKFRNYRIPGTLKTTVERKRNNGYDKKNQRQHQRSGKRIHHSLLDTETDNEEEEQDTPRRTIQQKPELYDGINSDEADEGNDEGQESLQSVESEQHDHYYNDVFNRDPRENEIDNDCPHCVDESLYTNKWTMPLLKLGEKRYYLGIFFKANWFKAAQYCRYHGMHLASISSQEENDRLEKHIRDFEGLGHEHFWTSGTDLADEGNYFWMANGRPISFTNWNAGEPNNFRYENGEEENCMELWNRDGKGLKWNDSPCSFETYFVCEVQAL